MKRRIEVLPIGLAFLAVAGISMAYQNVGTAAAEDAAKVFTKSCSVSGCHQGQYPPLGLNLETSRFQESLIDVPSRQKSRLKLVDTQNPDQSYLLMKIKGGEDIVGERMPLHSPPLKPAEIESVETWAKGLEGMVVRRGEASSENRVHAPAFWGTSVVNLPTPRAVGKGRVLFRVSHRFFPAVKDGYDAFYGLDGPGSIQIGLGYGFSDRFSLSLSRANVSKEFELALKWSPWIHTETGMPFSMAFLGSMGLMTVSQPGETTFREENLRFNVQASFAYVPHPKVSLLLVPGYTSNTNPAEGSPQGTLSLGLGGRLLIAQNLSLLLEWVPVLSGYSNESAGWGFGIEKKIGGHVFQVFALNSVGITTAQFVPGGELRLGDGEFRIGFNILRWF